MGVKALPLLPPAACIMAWRESYLPPYAPCVMAASGLCLSLLTLTERGGATAPGWGPQNPWRSDARLEGGGARRCAVRAPATLLPLAATPCPPPVPPCPPPRLGRRGPRVRFELAPPLVALYGQCGPPGERRGPALPRAPPPTTAGARGLAAPGGLLCRGGKATGRFIPAPNWGLCPRHRAQSPVGGYHTATGHKGEVIAPGIGLPQAEGRCQPPGSSWPPTSSS